MDEKLRTLFSERLKHYLELRGRTQADLARRMAVSSATVSDWVNGKKIPRTDKLQTICTWLGIEMGDLLENKEFSEPAYYNDPEIRKYAELLHKNPQARALLDASRNLTQDDLDFVLGMIERFSDND